MKAENAFLCFAKAVYHTFPSLSSRFCNFVGFFADFPAIPAISPRPKLPNVVLEKPDGAHLHVHCPHCLRVLLQPSSPRKICRRCEAHSRLGDACKRLRICISHSRLGDACKRLRICISLSRLGKPSHLSRRRGSLKLYSTLKNLLLSPVPRSHVPSAQNIIAPRRRRHSSLHFSLFSLNSKSRPEGRLSVFSKCFAALFGLLCLFLRLVVEDVFKILFAAEVLIFTALRAGVSESVRDLLCARRYSFRNL